MITHARSCVSTLFIAVAVLLLSESRGMGATITVYSNADNGAGSLRQAIHDAPAGSTINFSVTGTITLTSGQLLIDKNLNIVGPGARLLTVARSGSVTFRIFAVVAATVNLSGLTISNGYVVGGHGAGIGSSGNLTINDCNFRNNICAGGATRGGGVYNELRLTMNRCTVASNIASEGAGVSSSFAMVLKNCTVVSNAASTSNTTNGGGGGVLNLGSGTGTIHSCTIASNSASTSLAGGGGGGICNRGSALHLGNSIVAGNVSANVGPDVNGTFASDGYNLIGKGDGGSGFTATGDQVGSTASPLDPQLGSLQDNGGATDTRRPANTSPARDQGKNFGVTTDQRGHPRPYDFAVPNAFNGDGSDIGAFEESPRSLTVTNTNDSGPGSLRQCIADSGVDDNIGFDEAVMNRVITLTSGELLITRKTTIFGPQANLLTVARSSASNTPGFRIFHVTGGPVSISGLTISNGRTPNGGGILNQGLLTLADCVISGHESFFNNASGQGGGIANENSLNLVNCTIFNNHSGLSAGGLYNNDGSVTITACTFSNNSAPNNGGGIYNRAVLTIRNSTVFGNSCTTDGHGGGIYNGTGATLTLSSCTIAGNNAVGSSGSGVGGGGVTNVATCKIDNTIIANNTHSLSTTHDVSGTFTSMGYNLIGKRDGSSGFTAVGDQTGTNAAPKLAGLGPLQENGGPTETLGLLSGSPAIDKGNTSLTTDQRGHLRPYNTPGVSDAGNASDIGAFESRVFAGTVQFAAANFNTTEGSGTATFTLTRSGSTAGAALVHYYTWSGTAISNGTTSGDFFGVSGDIFFNDGVSTITRSFSLINNNICEPIEFLNLGLVSPPGGAPIGAQSTSKITIYDDDCSYSIIGRVTNSSGTGMPNIQITRTGGSNAITNSTGNYTFAGVKQGAYTIAPLITPGLSGISFNPPSYNVTVNTSNLNNINFTAFFTVTGKVTNSSGTGMPNIQVTRKTSTTSVTAITNSSGVYTFSGVRSGSYNIAPVVTPSMTGISFFPASTNVTVSTANLGNINFTAFFSISGKVTNSAGTGLANVLVTRASGGSSTSVVTNSSGNYTFGGVRSGTHTITPSQSGKTFSPTSRTLSVGSANLTNINFIGS